MKIILNKTNLCQGRFYLDKKDLSIKKGLFGFSDLVST